MTDIDILRDLAQQYVETAALPVMDRRRDLRRRHNSLKRTRLLVYVRAFAWQEMPESQLHCEDPFFRGIENTLRQSLFRYTSDDDANSASSHRRALPDGAGCNRHAARGCLGVGLAAHAQRRCPWLLRLGCAHQV